MIDCTDTVNDVKLNQSLLQKSHSIAKKYLLFLMDLTAKGNVIVFCHSIEPMCAV